MVKYITSIMVENSTTIIDKSVAIMDEIVVSLWTK